MKIIFISLYYIGILKESIEVRESCKSKEKVIEEQEKTIADLKTELVQIDSRITGNMEEIKSTDQKERKTEDIKRFKKLTESVDLIRKEHVDVRAHVANTLTIYSTELRRMFELVQKKHDLLLVEINQPIDDQFHQTTRNQLHQHHHGNKYNNDVMDSPDGCNGDAKRISETKYVLSQTDASSDSESLFIPRQSSDSLNTTSPTPQSAISSGQNKESDKDIQSKICSLCSRWKHQLVEKHKEETRRQNMIHKIQIDTIVRGMAKRQSKKTRPILTPSPKLFNDMAQLSLTHQGQSEFLKNCTDRLKYLKE